MRRSANFFFLASVLGWLTAAVFGQGSVVSGRVTLFRADGKMRTDNNAGVVVWLTPLSAERTTATGKRNVSPRPKIIQRNKRFETRVLAVEVGSMVDFPNLDPFFHNVFSLFDGKRFDLGLYEAGSTKSVRFDSPGVCYIFCNIHSQMSAAVVVVDSPYFVLLSTPGEFRISQAPSGRYQLNVWAERCSAESLKAASRQITVEGASTSLETIRLQESRDLATIHANKYGQPYETPVFSSPIYVQP